MEEQFLTRYALPVEPHVLVRRVTFRWRLDSPHAGPGCNLLAPQNATREGTAWIGHASWLPRRRARLPPRGDGRPGHPGYVTVVVRIVTHVRGKWECAGGIRGTVRQTSPYVSSCRKQR